MRTTATIKSNRESGYGLIFAAIAMVVLLGAAGFSVDIGYLRYQRRLLQSATDSAALAGAAQLGQTGNRAQAITAAKTDSKVNGFEDGQGNIVVTANRITLNGNNNTMQVQVSNTYPTFFMRVFGGSLSNVTVTTSATAQYIGSRGCIYALTGGNGINVTGNVNVPNCDVLSNQSISGNGSLTAAAIGANVGSSVAATPPAITGTIQASDPLSFLPAANTGGGCTTIDLDGNDNKNGPRTLTPNTYCSITFEPARRTRRGFIPAYNQKVTFAQGTYVITQAGLDFEGTGQVVSSGSGVTFYLAGGSVVFGNQQQIQLKANTSTATPYTGILMFQPAGNTRTATINGANGSFLQGALYFPNARIQMNGAGTGAQYMMLVAKTLNLNTNVNFPSDYSSLPNGSPIRTATLVQ